MKYLKQFSEVPLIKLLKPEDLKKINKLFKTNYQPQIKSTSKIHILLSESFREIEKIMKEKPKGGGYGL